MSPGGEHYFGSGYFRADSVLGLATGSSPLGTDKQLSE